MEHPSPNLIRDRHGFSLIELLIALALVSVVMALAWILLDSTRKVAGEVQSPVDTALSPLWAQMQDEFDRLLLYPVNTKKPPLRFSEDEGLELVSLLPGLEDTLLQTELHYFISEDGLVKISAPPFPKRHKPISCPGKIEALRVLGKREEEEFSLWPNEQEQDLFPRIEVTLLTEDGLKHSRTFFLPVSLKVAPSELPDSNSGN